MSGHPLRIVFILFLLILRRCPLPNTELACLCFAKYITQIGSGDLGDTILTRLIGMSIPGAYKNFYVIWEIVKEFFGDWNRNALLTDFVARMANSSQSPVELTKLYLQIERMQLRISDPPTWWTQFMKSSVNTLCDVHESGLMDIIECVLPRFAGTNLPSSRRGTKRVAGCLVAPFPKRICITYYQLGLLAPKKRARAIHDTSSTKRPCLSTAKCVMCSTYIPSGKSTCSSQCDLDFAEVYEY